MCLSPKTIIKQSMWLTVGCGKCFECLQKKSTEWAYRIALESQLYERNCMITLTYNEDNCPKDSHLSKRDLQLFFKRLRKHFEPNKIRFFGCGEYGTKNGRPHYHLILFNHDFDDKYWFCKDKKGTDLFRSPTLEKLWDKGFSSVGEVSFDSAKYCAIYMQKPPKDGRPKPFILMSRRPGIGRNAIREQWLASDKIYHNGKYIKIPRYFLDCLEKQYPDLVEVVKNKRVNNILQFQSRSQANADFDDKLKRIKRLKKVFKDDLADYFDLAIDFGEIQKIKEDNQQILTEMQTDYKKQQDKIKFFENSLDFENISAIIDNEVCVKAINFCE